MERNRNGYNQSIRNNRIDPGLSEPIALAAASIKEGVAPMLYTGKSWPVAPQFSPARKMKNETVRSEAIVAGDKPPPNTALETDASLRRFAPSFGAAQRECWVAENRISQWRGIEAAIANRLGIMEIDLGLSEPIALAAAGIKEGVAPMLCAGKLGSVVPQFSAARRIKNKTVRSDVVVAGDKPPPNTALETDASLRRCAPSFSAAQRERYVSKEILS